jgi:hypothetical protein
MVIVAVPVFPLKSKVGSFVITSGIVTPPDTDHLKGKPDLITVSGDHAALVEVVVNVICAWPIIPAKKVNTKKSNFLIMANVLN